MIEMLLPLEPTVRKLVFPRVMLPALVPVPALSVTTVPVVLALKRPSPIWLMLPFTEPVVLIDTMAGVVGTMPGETVREVGVTIVTVGVDV